MGMYRIYFIPRERIEEWERGENIPYKSKVRRPRDNVEGVMPFGKALGVQLQGIASTKGSTIRPSHEVSELEIPHRGQNRWSSRKFAFDPITLSPGRGNQSNHRASCSSVNIEPTREKSPCSEETGIYMDVFFFISSGSIQKKKKMYVII
ncbi:hypothetical protein CEXT_673511 [Caerostris extrusa]|uniref:Uncharacterized protein n=1 Tax=Caerostris extrusa TaxID=172846 RepID=A0AAV4XV98_CAEEX|nr:hypothetical protein CEXT_673511 [Caerostris extrusa]